jgi:hypothetical protein
MKIRNGFVSNSSSSSFIVKFPSVPKSVDDVIEILFGDKTKYRSPYGDNMWDVSKVAKTVFNDIQEQGDNITEAIKLLSYSHMCPIEYNDYQKISGDWRSMDHEAYNSACEECGKKEFEKFYSLKKIRKDKLSKIEGKDISGGEILYVFSYSDNDGEYFSDLEHGGLFDKVEHIVISQH